MRLLGVIPARYASTRFPGKPLVMLAGKTMVERTYRQVSQANFLDEVVVATDDLRIYEHVVSFGGKAIITSETCRSGTDRAAEALSMIGGFDGVVNIQGDEPFIHPSQIDLVAGQLRSHRFEIATLAKEIDSENDIFNPNVVKVVFDIHGKALYFSRSPIPYLRGWAQENWSKETIFHKHIGLYAYRADILMQLTALSPSRLEIAESLEQLRWLENGYSIGVTETDLETIGIDTPEDLAKINSLLGTL